MSPPSSGDLAGDGAQQRGFAGAVAADQADAAAGIDREIGPVQQGAATKADDGTGNDEQRHEADGRPWKMRVDRPSTLPRRAMRRNLPRRLAYFASGGTGLCSNAFIMFAMSVAVACEASRSGAFSGDSAPMTPAISIGPAIAQGTEPESAARIVEARIMTP